MTEILKNDRYIRALLRQEVDRTPIWIMRQAGRYLPEYRQTRARAGDFLSLCKNPELACEVTLQPIDRFDLDAAILFSDILTIPDAMGLGLHFKTGEGPVFDKPTNTLAAIQALEVPAREKLDYVPAAVKTIKRALNGRVPLIGFSGSPWTLATYMVEGGPSKTHSVIKALMYKEPETLKHLLNVLANSVTDYLNSQIEAGVNAVMIFDTWGGVLSTPCYYEFSLHYMQRILNGLIKERDGQIIPATIFTKGGAPWLEAIANTGCQAVGLDWTINIADAKSRIGHQVALQGNMDPNVLYAAPKVIQQEVKRILQGFGHAPGHIFNLGHGIHPDISPEHVKILVEAVHEGIFEHNPAMAMK